MKRSTLAARAVLLILVFASVRCPAVVAEKREYPYCIGCGSADITGPVVGVQFWGFVRADQTGEGLHLRQRARAFVVVDPQTTQRIALVVCDLGSVTHEVHREVVERLQNELGDTYSLANVIIGATHTHAAPGGFWHTGVGTPLGSDFHSDYFHVIVDGIVTAIREAHESLQPGNILIAQGEAPDAGANRSLVAYMKNPADERARYDSNTDSTMTLLRFETVDGPIGCVNWHAVHPTTMTYNNKLVSSDSKGYAEVTFERQQGVTYEKPHEFVAAFAQSNCGDVTGNLNLDNTGPGKDEFETTRIIGERQRIVARELFNQAEERLTGPIGTRQAFVDFSSIAVTSDFTLDKPQSTAPAAFGYSFAAGSTEDGGGNPLFKEGMTEKLGFIESTLNLLFPGTRPSDALRSRHRPKAILIAPGEMRPQPGVNQVLSLTVARIGPLVLVAGPAEFTTMSGRRIRDSVRDVMGEGVREVVIAGYANGYAGYVTTFEEYQTQQYEGGHTLFGPWTLAAYQQEYARLAQALHENRPVESSTASVIDLRDQVASTPLGTTADVPPEDANFGDQITPPKTPSQRGNTVSAVFWTGNPQNSYPHNRNFACIELQTGDAWTRIATDADWSTKCTFQPSRNVAKPYQIAVTWDIPLDVTPGTYRIVHHGHFRLTEAGDPTTFTAKSDPFRVE